jgi:death-on-curing protein
VIAYLTLDEVLAIHATRIGPGLVRDPGQVAANVGRAAQGFGDVEFYPSLAAKAEALFHAFASTQPFVDGNKRMAVYVTNVFLLTNGFRCVLDDADMYHLAMDAAHHQLDVEKITQQLERHMVELDLPDN